MGSTSLLPSCTKLPLSSEILLDLIDKAKDWTIMHGMGYRPKTNTDNNLLQHAPFTILPSTFPKNEFENACDIQIILNMLIHKVAYDYEFIKETLIETIKVDEFTRKLFEIYETVYHEGINQKISLGLIRSDLMLDTSCSNDDNIQSPYCCWKQVEINTIASGMGGLGTATTAFHKFILNELDMKDSVKYLPENNALEGMTMAMLEAWKIYDNPHAIILFVVEEFALNICDQRLHEFDVTKHNVRVIRRTLTQLTIEAKLGPNNELYVNDKIVAVVYYRIGYSPNQYYTQKEWDVRLLIERSLAIKCPSIQYHLAGTKKIQQALARPGVVAQYLDNEKTVERVKKIFTGLYSLEMNESGNAALEMALKNPKRFVLKPQREGGGNNIYGDDIKPFLESIEPQERNAWILMDRIHPPSQSNYFISVNNPKDFELKKLISELGIFGAIIGDDKNIFLNKQVGHVLRTKLVTSNEGGLMSGTAACDSPFLID
ncbi:hypothetical protein PV325_002348 [Microctonus aethiopoides]|nr:hypothetical protein PV325_002348 [Microctonus aethiopoides]